ncbi:MAG: protelomerase family protein, partial [Cyanobacteria bacterium J06576_12]
LEATKQAVQSEDWRDLAASLIMATQSRPSDMLKTGEFKAISKYRLEFSSRAKKRGAIAKGEIFCLIEASVFVDAFSRLRREPDVMEMRDWALKDVDSGKNATLNRAVKRIYGDIIPVPFGEKELSCKNLRAAGVNVAYWLHGRDNQSLGRFAELQLLHENPGTAANYEDFYCTKENGKRLLKVGILKDAPLSAKPLSEKRSSLSLDKQLLEMVSDAAQWGEGSHADRLERIIARAKQADRVEAQLARECEKRQQLEFQVKRLQMQLDEQPEPEYEPVREDELIAIDKPVVEDETPSVIFLNCFN